MVPIVPSLIVPVLTEHFRVEQMMTSFVGRVRDMVIIDNGPCDWTPRDDWAERVWHLRMPANQGVAGSWNLGIKAIPKSLGWMVVNHDITFGENGVADFFASCSPSNLVLGGKPPWSCFWLGSEVVKKVGLFHEGFHPAYFEDNDYEIRVQRKGCDIVRSTAAIYHRNSSTLASSDRFKQLNSITFAANHDLFQQRMNVDHDLDWDLQRRLDLGWD